MKEFDKWFKKNKPYEVYSCMNMAEKAWKAALEWVLEDTEYTGDCGESLIDQYEIQEELEI